MFRVISIDVFELVGVCPFRCIGVATRVAASVQQRPWQ
jgi:hypothetical protein